MAVLHVRFAKSKGFFKANKCLKEYQESFETLQTQMLLNNTSNYLLIDYNFHFQTVLNALYSGLVLVVEQLPQL